MKGPIIRAMFVPEGELKGTKEKVYVCVCERDRENGYF